MVYGAEAVLPSDIRHDSPRGGGVSSERWLMIFPHRKTPYIRRWESKGHQGAHEAGGAPRGVGRAPHPRGQGVAPGELLALSIFYIF